MTFRGLKMTAGGSIDRLGAPNDAWEVKMTSGTLNLRLGAQNDAWGA